LYNAHFFEEAVHAIHRLLLGQRKFESGPTSKRLPGHIFKKKEIDSAILRDVSVREFKNEETVTTGDHYPLDTKELGI
jgi:hypothetical protein